MRQGVPVQAWMASAGSGLSQLSAKARAIPRTPLLVVTGIVAIAILVVAVLALRGPGPVATPPTGLVVIEAVPWATVTAIRGADGANHLATPAATPLSMSLPAGKYSADLAGPSSSQTRTIEIDVTGDGVTVAPAAVFTPLTSDEYFKQYFGGDAPAPSNPAPGATP